MDLCKRLSSVSGLSEYIELTQDLETKHKDVNIPLNMTTILSMKKHRCMEIEYFNKCDGTGAALKMFERMLNTPASKTWGLVGSEIVSLLQYWLEAVRKHLMSHHIHWWTFLKYLLNFIKILRRKDTSISNVLVEEISEVILDLACGGRMEVTQKYETLHTFNLICADSSREVRMALRGQLEPYFIRLATSMATCGHWPVQLSSLETLLRWLQPRRSALARRAAADRWLLPHLYAPPARDLFLHRPWVNFFQDARDFLNCHNEIQDLVTSVVCRKLTVGNIALLTGSERREWWLDVNPAGGASVLLEPPVLQALRAPADNCCEALCIHKDVVTAATLYQDNMEIKLRISMMVPPAILPSDHRVFPQEECDVTVVISTRSNMARLSRALAMVFEDKYKNNLDLEAAIQLSPVHTAAAVRNDSTDDQTRFSHPVKEKTKKPLRSGYISWRKFSSLRSPSSVSTSSLAQLHDKLENLPPYEFTKEPVSVVAQPELSVVNEVNESEISNSIGSSSTLVLRRCAVQTFRDYIEDRKSQSDNETARNNDINKRNRIEGETSETIIKETLSDNEYVKKPTRCVEDVSSLFTATIGSAEDSVINETIERFPKDKALNTDNLIELLMQEALQAKNKEDKTEDSGINTGDVNKTKEPDSETIEDTQYVATRNFKSKRAFKSINAEPTTPKKSILVSKSTSDESNTEAINETPINYVNVRKRNLRKKLIKPSEIEPTVEKSNENVFDVQAVEEFFSQHFAENKVGEVLISPTLAKKINETSSEGSDDEYLMNVADNFDIRNENIPDLDVAECINDVVDKVVTKEFTETVSKETCEKAKAYNSLENDDRVEPSVPVKPQEQEIEEVTTIDNYKEANLQQDPVISANDSKDKENKKPKKTRAKAKNVTKNKPIPKKKKPVPKKGKLKLEPVSKMSTIIEDVNESDSKTSASDRKTSADEKKTPLPRRRRKLYSPKNDQMALDNDDTIEKVLLAEAESADKTAGDEVPVAQTDDEEDIALAKLKKDAPVTPKYSKPVVSKYSEVTPVSSKPVTPKSSEAITPQSSSYVTPKSAATSYKEIEEERKRYRTRARKAKGATSPLSPKTKKANELFENLKSHLENTENIILVDKKSDKDIAIFNFTSDSEDEEFKQKKCEVQKRTSTTTVASGTSVMSTRRGRKKKEAKVESRESSNDTYDKPKRKRVTRRKSTKRKAETVQIEAPKDLIDERMRDAEPEVLNTSFAAENVEKEIEIIEALEPAIQAPVVEMIEDNIEVENGTTKQIPVVKVTKCDNTLKLHKKATKRQAEKAKLEVKEVDDNKKDDEGTVSPLPGLIIETEKGKTDIEDTSLNTNLVAKFQKIYKEGPEACNYNDTENTQNLLLDDERPNLSPQIDITAELGIARNDNEVENNLVESNSDAVTVHSGLSSKVSRTNSVKSRRDRLRLKTKKKADPVLSTTGDITVVANQTNMSMDLSIELINTKDTCTGTKEEKHLQKRKASKEQAIKNSQISIKSNIEQINFNEIISLHSETLTRARAKSKSGSQEIDIIDITNANYNGEIKSEKSILNNSQVKSIPTGSITAHGEEKETPPNTRLLTENISHREIHDMDQYIKECFIDLNKQVNISKDSTEIPEVGDHKFNEITKDTTQDRDDASETTENTRKKRFDDRDYDITNLLPSRRNSDTDNSSQTSTRVKTPTVSLTRLTTKEIAKYQSSSNSIEECSLVKTKPISRPSKSPKPNRRSPRIAKNKKSQISPINLDDFLPKSLIPNDTPRSKYVTRHSQSLETTPPIRPTYTSSPIQDSIQSTPKKSSKRSSPVINYSGNKRRKLNQETRIESVNISLSTQSSNVDDWLRQISAISRVNDDNQASYDIVQNLMEKLDTTLVEIHQNTTKDFIGLFVEAQRRLVEARESRREEYRQTAATVMTEVTRLLDHHFSELDQRAEERGEQLMSWLRGRAGEVLRRDCSQKRALLAILREDAQTAAARLRRGQ